MSKILDLISEGSDLVSDYQYTVNKATNILDALKSLDLSVKDKEKVIEKTGIDVDMLIDELDSICW